MEPRVKDATSAVFPPGFTSFRSYPSAYFTPSFRAASTVSHTPARFSSSAKKVLTE